MTETQPQYQATGHGGTTDAEAETDHRKTNLRTKCILYILLFIIFQTAIITIFALTVMKIRTPKFSVRDAAVTNFNGGTTARLKVEFAVKNTNFGRYSYRNATVVFKYRGTAVGSAAVRRSKANWRSTKRFNVEVDLNLVNPQTDSQLRQDLNSGIIPITSEGKLRGRVELMWLMKKNKSTGMNCSMIIAAQQQITNIVCL